jgi:hypothetical protein
MNSASRKSSASNSPNCSAAVYPKNCPNLTAVAAFPMTSLKVEAAVVCRKTMN